MRNRELMKNLAVGMLAAAAVGCGSSATSVVGERTQALEDAAWQTSRWISAANAPIVTGSIDDHRNGLSADGASWFTSTIKNEQKVVAARWMTAGLGVYELYVNGKPVGQEVLKPGFTHREKTKRSFTYDITRAIQRRAGDENTLSVQVTP